VPDVGDELHFGRPVRVVVREDEMRLEEAAFTERE